MVGKHGVGWGARGGRGRGRSRRGGSLCCGCGRDVGCGAHRTDPLLPNRRVLRRRRSDLPTTATALLQQSHHGGSLGTIADCRLLQQRAVWVDLVGDELMRHLARLVRAVAVSSTAPRSKAQANGLATDGGFKTAV